MKQTENYQLNQWEKQDRIMMEDFNADNAKIDAAIALHPSAEFLLGGTVETAVTQIDLDLSQVDWSKYLMVILEVESVAKTHMTLSGGLAGESSYMSYFAGSSVNGNLMTGYECQRLTAVMPVLYSGERHPTVLGFGGGMSDSKMPRGFGSFGAAPYPIRNLTALRLHNSYGGFQPGDIVKLWGVK